jgi:phosphatidate cytidylyltransferase
MIFVSEIVDLAEFNGGVLMKTRIISGAALVLIAAVVLGLSLKFHIILPFVFAALGAVAVYEILYSTKIVTVKSVVYFSALPALIMPFVFLGIFKINVAFVYVIFAVAQFVIYLKLHSKIKLEGLFAAILLPILISYGFSAFSILARFPKLFYVVLLLCWSAVADTGAYFTGVFLGKHKMAPVISPKKTWEGFLGGIVFSALAVLGVSFIYKSFLGVENNVLLNVLVTPIFVSVGVLGDLAASLIKRQCNIKDYGKLIPGHGGIMDRFDSNLMIAPVFYLLVSNFPILAY